MSNDEATSVHVDGRCASRISSRRAAPEMQMERAGQ